jgi:hypothetical protein
MDEEFRLHFERRTDDLVRLGMTRKDAARRAPIEFGNPNAHKDRCRQSRRIHLLDDLTADLRFTFRSVRKHVVLSSAVVVTLTLGIGTSSAVFTFVNADVLRPRVETDPGSFVRVYVSYTTDLTKRGPFGGVSLEDYIAMRDGSRSLHDVAAWSQTFAPVEHDDPTPVGALADHVQYLSNLRPRRRAAWTSDRAFRLRLGASRHRVEREHLPSSGSGRLARRTSARIPTEPGLACVLLSRGDHGDRRRRRRAGAGVRVAERQSRRIPERDEEGVRNRGDRNADPQSARRDASGRRPRAPALRRSTDSPPVFLHEKTMIRTVSSRPLRRYLRRRLVQLER